MICTRRTIIFADLTVMSTVRRVVTSGLPALGLSCLLFLLTLRVAGAWAGTRPAPASPSNPLRQPAAADSHQEDALTAQRTASAEDERDRLVYAEDFSDPKSGWRVSEDADASFAYSEEEYQIVVTAASHWATAEVDVPLEDYAIETDVRCARGECGSYGIVFGLNGDGTELYALTINDEGEYAVWKYDGDRLSALIDWRTSPELQPGSASNRIAVTREGAGITATANGDLLVRLSDAVYTGPRTTGVFVLNTSTNGDSVDVRFDNFRLYTLSEATDYAKHKMVSASSTASRFEIGSAVDDNVETLWTSGSDEEYQYIYIDMGATYTADQVFVNWVTSATQWGLAAWDGSTWETVAATSAGLNGVRILEFAPREAQFWTLRMWTRPESEPGYALREFALRGPPEQNPNLALAKSARASSSAEDSAAENVIDGNANTQWISGPAQRQSLLIDFDQALPLDRVTINWAESYAREYGVLVGLADQWEWIAITATGQGGTETIDFERTAAEWVLLYVWDQAIPGGYSISEISVWDSLGGGRLEVGEPIPPISGGVFDLPIGVHRALEDLLSYGVGEIQSGKPAHLPPAPDPSVRRRLNELQGHGGN